MNIQIWLPLIPAAVIYLFVFFYNLKDKRQPIWRGRVGNKIGMGFIMLLIIWTSSSLIIDPNSYAKGIGGNSSYLYTTGRQLAWILMAIGYSGVHAEFLSQDNMKQGSNEQNTASLSQALKLIYIFAAISALLSGGYGFLTRTCWGVFESRYIQDPFMWWAELGWCIAGIIGLFAYFKYIRYWGGKEQEN